jgi:hypothetical protein
MKLIASITSQKHKKANNYKFTEKFLSKIKKENGFMIDFYVKIPR